ncbi:MAG: energy-coupling factor transporter transmembrane component T family protein [Erysipelotrichaceae bacterium]
MSNKLFNYKEENTLIHRLSGFTKLLVFLVLSFSVMLSYDIRFIALVALIGIIALRIAKIRWKRIRLMIYYMGAFLLLNTFLSFLFSPLEGVSIYGTQTNLIHLFGNYTVTVEELFYLLTKASKYLAAVPLGIMFLLTTNPSEFAASLHRIGVSYKIAYAVALTLRYIPDVQRDYTQIALATQARGLDLSSKEKTSTRIKNAMGILVPLIFSTLDRVESISNAMDLRGFGKLKQRSWYSAKPLQASDRWMIAFSIAVFALSIYLTVFVNQSRFFNPFM